LASGREGADIASAHFNYSALVKVLHQRSLLDREAAADFGSKAFVASQWASSSQAASSVAQMAVRHAKGESALSKLARERQDLTGELSALDRSLLVSLSQSPDRRDNRKELELRSRLQTIVARLRDIDAEFVSNFPEYAALANPEPLSISETQALIGQDEAVVVFFETPSMAPLAGESICVGRDAQRLPLAEAVRQPSMVRQQCQSLALRIGFGGMGQ
jgi:hypothetical protein